MSARGMLLVVSKTSWDAHLASYENKSSPILSIEEVFGAAYGYCCIITK